MKKNAEEIQENRKESSPLSLEENMEQLKNVLQDLESGEHSLEESFSLYEKGIKLVRQANAQIDLVEKKIQVLKEDDSYGDL
ncbi:MAG: exodeoxyribonuclease VII small subunit [Lachnospiraceae bacterium]|nr:exodeoxyribonuclease VII small subunit [Lachnospiraceae bacterium]